MRTLSAVMLAAVLTLQAGCARRGAVERVRTQETLVHDGRLTFQAVCASCHGLDGRGSGPVAQMLVVPPSDLTTLSRRYDGRFPAAELRDVVNVHRVIPAHGTEELPVWGDIWTEKGAYPRRRDIVDYEIDGLIAYIRSIQRDGRK